MGGFLATPAMQSPAQPPAVSGPAGLAGLLGAQAPAQSPMQQQVEANAGSLQQLRALELQITSVADSIQQMSAAYPGAAEDARMALQAADAMRQALTGFVVAIVSQMPSAQPSGPPFLGA